MRPKDGNFSTCVYGNAIMTSLISYLVWSKVVAVRRSWNMLEQDPDKTLGAYPLGEAQRGVWHHRGTWSHDWEGGGRRDTPPCGRGAHRGGYHNPAP